MRIEYSLPYNDFKKRRGKKDDAMRIFETI